MILFSIPVHEQPAVIVNQVENFTFFNPGCQIVLHVSAWMPENEVNDLRQSLAAHPNVHINETRLWSGYADGSQMKMHVVNCEYAQKLGIPYDYFCIHASNDMFVRSGLEDYIKTFDIGGFFFGLRPDTSGYVHLVRAQSDRLLKKMMKKYGITTIIGGQIEGTFYRKPIMETVAGRIRRDAFYEIPGIYAQATSRSLTKLVERKASRYLIRKLNKGLLYAKEEIYFATLSQDMAKTCAPYSYVYMNWFVNLKVTEDDVNNIRSHNYAGLDYLRNIPVPAEQLNFFSVKRVDRKINDPIRQYITGLQK
jgi:hypothetical protein